jgi:hypothetical protein
MHMVGNEPLDDLQVWGCSQRFEKEKTDSTLKAAALL